MAKFNRRAAERPSELLDAALEQFHRVGFTSARIEEIARSAGVTVGTVYRYFPSKESLFRAVVERHLDSGWSRGREIAEAYGALTAREVVALLVNRWEAALREPGPRRVAILVMREAPLFPDVVALYESELLTRGRLAIERALRHGIERGEFPLLPIEATARALIGAPLEQLLWEATFGTAVEEGSQAALLVRGLPRGDQLPLPPPAPVPAPRTPVAPGTLRITTLRPPGSD